MDKTRQIKISKYLSKHLRHEPEKIGLIVAIGGWVNVDEYLLQHEAEHNARLGILQTLLHHPERYPESPYLALVQNKSHILATAIRTPPNHLLLSKVQDLNALLLIAQDLQQVSLPGISFDLSADWVSSCL